MPITGGGLPPLFITTTVWEQNPRSHHKGTTGSRLSRVPPGDQLYQFYVIANLDTSKTSPYIECLSLSNNPLPARAALGPGLLADLRPLTAGRTVTVTASASRAWCSRTGRPDARGCDDDSEGTI